MEKFMAEIVKTPDCRYNIIVYNKCFKNRQMRTEACL